jgi:plastocyanin
MSNGTLFYICGSSLAVSAVLITLAGLRLKSFPGRYGAVVALWFVALVGVSTTLAVLHAQDEQEAEAAELTRASEEAEGAEQGAPTLKLAADPTTIAFDTTKLSAKSGKVTIDFDNPSALEHNVAIEQNGKQIAISETIAEGETSVNAELEPGTYTFLCTVPGHAEAGMQGTLTVK